MQKDVIYIDVEDDITAIIGKVKDSKEKIVVLVPPKRIGAIQSAVNLKLVHRAADQANKRLVLISNNQALMALAGSAGIPVAKNLQSKPEMAEVPALEVDGDDDIIDGGDLPVGEHAKQADKMEVTELGAVAVAADEVEDDSVAPKAAAAATATAKKKTSSKTKIPNFDIFRRKLFLILAAGLLFVGFLIWAIFFAPTARIVVLANTSDSALNSRVDLSPTVESSLKAGTIKSEVKTLTRDVSVPFTATGEKDIGERATGTVRMSINDIPSLGTTVPAGTVLTSSGGKTYTTNSSVTFTMSNWTGANTAITATASGSSFNGATGSMSGAPSGVAVRLTDATTGGTDKVAKVVTQSDVDTATPEIAKQANEEEAKAELKKQFGDDYIVIESSFGSDTSEVKPSPAVDAEAADGKAALSGPAKFTLIGVKKSELAKYLDAYFKQQIDGKPDQKVYDNGLSRVNFTNIASGDGKYSATISTNGKLGPQLDEAGLKEYAKGKRFGEIQSHVEAVTGVESADIKFSPFWVSSAPNDEKRITVEFKINE